ALTVGRHVVEFLVWLASRMRLTPTQSAHQVEVAGQIRPAADPAGSTAGVLVAPAQASDTDAVFAAGRDAPGEAVRARARPFGSVRVPTSAQSGRVVVVGRAAPPARRRCDRVRAAGEAVLRVAGSDRCSTADRTDSGRRHAGGTDRCRPSRGVIAGASVPV